MLRYIIKYDCLGNLRIDVYDPTDMIVQNVIPESRPFHPRQQEFFQDFDSVDDAISLGQERALEYSQTLG